MSRINQQTNIVVCAVIDLCGRFESAVCVGFRSVASRVPSGWARREGVLPAPARRTALEAAVEPRPVLFSDIVPPVPHYVWDWSHGRLVTRMSQGPIQIIARQQVIQACIQ
jgi:hypothetical protein